MPSTNILSIDSFFFKYTYGGINIEKQSMQTIISTG